MMQDSRIQASQQTTIISFDGTQLEVRLYTASSLSGNSSPAEDRGSASTEIAIIAHPYGFLGGSLSDHVVQALKDTLCQQGIPTLLYNSRGVGSSSGRASWTGEPERKDYQAMVDWTANHASSMPSWTGRSGGQRRGKLTIYCCGYSFGALMAGQAVTPTALDPEMQVELRYILVSPPISSVVGFLLTPFRTSQYTRALQRIVSVESQPPEEVLDGGTVSPKKILCVYGDHDNFTDASTYRDWAKKIRGDQQQVHPLLSVIEIQEANHFWTKPRHQSELLEAVCNWL